MLERVLDPYERKARLTPALLALAPAFAVVIGLYGVRPDLGTMSVGILTAFGFFYVLASVARELGKRLENRLFSSWGGKPTTQLLRHADQTLDPLTKMRYHAFLSRHIGVPFPTVAEEQHDPLAADQRYAAGAKWLLDQTRDTKKFPLLFKENIAYGFRRNALGLKPYALVVAAVSWGWVLVAVGIINSSGVHLDILTQASAGAWAAIGGSPAACALWVFFFTERTVRTAAFTYADMLLRACDSLS
jgi:hypothetical protein